MCEPSSWSSFKSANTEKFHFEAEQLGRRYLEIFEPAKQTASILTPREREILRYVAQGRTDEQVAALIGIGKWTVVTHMQSAKYKLGCSNRAAAVAKAVSYGLIDIRPAV
jgi:DNA-binding CsgD family transcriptional regulator